MIPYQADPSLHPAEPAPPQLDDGFAPPQWQAQAQAEPPARKAAPAEPVDPALWAKSDF
jgi:hypothetical protein